MQEGKPNPQRIVGDQAAVTDPFDGEVLEGITKRQQQTRPGPITLIALFQFSKAAFLFVVVVLVWLSPEMQWGSRTFWGSVYIASHGGGLPSFLTPIVAVYAAIIGVGLWRLQRWARNLLMVTSGLSAARWLRYFSLNWAIGGTGLGKHVNSLNSEFERQTVYVLVLIDIFVFLCLVYFPGVAEAFRVEE